MSAAAVACESPRLRLRFATREDAPFILELLNEPSWKRFIGDKGVATLEAARGYIERSLLASYERNGHGLYVVVMRESDEPIGLCGLVRREALPEVDLGFALLERHHGCGYAREAARASVELAMGPLGLRRLLAVTDPDNERSLRLLEDLGFTRQGSVKLSPDGHAVTLLALDAVSAGEDGRGRHA